MSTVGDESQYGWLSGVVTDPELIVDYDDSTDEWIGRCSEHGEVSRLPGSVKDHNRTVMRLAQHEEYVHDGTGEVHYSLWLF